MIYKPCLILLTLTLLLLSLASKTFAIGITIDTLSFVESYALSPNGTAGQKYISTPTGSGNFVLNTTASSTRNGSARSDASWSFDNMATQATWRSSQTLSDQVQANYDGFSSSARAQSVLNFTLTEAVNYSISGLLGGVLQAGATAEYFGNLVNGFGSPAPIPSTWQEDELLTASTQVFGTLLAWSGNETGSLTGQLLPGTYAFAMTGDTRNGLGGNGQGSFRFTMTPTVSTIPSVPDGGSTLILMGLAFSAIGVVRRRLKN